VREDQPRLKLVIVFNHRFERNLPLLDRLYCDRFPLRHVLMPFAEAPEPGVTSVYELGWNFQGHIAQGARDFPESGVSHYLFIGDDLLLNPAIDAANLVATLGLEPGQAYIKNLIAADALRDEWVWAGEAAAKLARNGKALDWQALLPPADEARARFEAMGIAIPDRPGTGWRGALGRHWRHPRERGWGWLEGLTLRGRPAAYPLLSGYADFVLVPAANLPAFARYCGVFAALDVFAEVALPTALALACDDVVTELAPNTHFRWPGAARTDSARLSGQELWTPRDHARLEPLLRLPLPELLARFPSDWLYIHPVKLSRYVEDANRQHRG
jgi:hypothetical protein